MKVLAYTPEHVHLVIRLKAKKNCVKEALDAVYETISATHKEEGCLEYRVFHKDREILVTGTWKDQMAMDLHLLLQFHLRMYEEKLPPLCKKMTLKQFKEVEPPITALSIS